MWSESESSFPPRRLSLSLWTTYSPQQHRYCRKSTMNTRTMMDFSTLCIRQRIPLDKWINNVFEESLSDSLNEQCVNTFGWMNNVCFGWMNNVCFGWMNNVFFKQSLWILNVLSTFCEYLWLSLRIFKCSFYLSLRIFKCSFYLWLSLRIFKCCLVLLSTMTRFTL